MKHTKMFSVNAKLKVAMEKAAKEAKVMAEMSAFDFEWRKLMDEVIKPEPLVEYHDYQWALNSLEELGDDTRYHRWSDSKQGSYKWYMSFKTRYEKENFHIVPTFRTWIGEQLKQLLADSLAKRIKFINGEPYGVTKHTKKHWTVLDECSGTDAFQWRDMLFFNTSDQEGGSRCRVYTISGNVATFRELFIFKCDSRYTHYDAYSGSDEDYYNNQDNIAGINYSGDHIMCYCANKFWLDDEAIVARTAVSGPGERPVQFQPAHDYPRPFEHLDYDAHYYAYCDANYIEPSDDKDDGFPC